MSENKRLIGSVNVTSTEIKCPGCGASIGIRFNPSSTTLTCPFCGLSSYLPTPQNGAVAEELDFNAAMQRASVDWGHYKKLIICSNCGGQTVPNRSQAPVLSAVQQALLPLPRPSRSWCPTPLSLSRSHLNRLRNISSAF